MTNEELQLYTTILLAIITIFLIPISKYILTLEKRLIKIETKMEFTHIIKT